MKQYLPIMGKVTVVVLLILSTAAYFYFANNQDLTLAVLSLVMFVTTSVFRIHYKKLLLASGIFIITATICKELTVPVLASELISLAFVMFSLGVFKIIMRKVFALYGVSISTIYL